MSVSVVEVFRNQMSVIRVQFIFTMNFLSFNVMNEFFLLKRNKQKNDFRDHYFNIKQRTTQYYNRFYSQITFFLKYNHKITYILYTYNFFKIMFSDVLVIYISYFQSFKFESITESSSSSMVYKIEITIYDLMYF